MLQTVVQQQQDQAQKIAIMQYDLSAVKQELGSFTKIVKDGNGGPSLVVRSVLLEERMRELLENMKEVQKIITDRQTEDHRGRWLLVVAITAGLLSLLAQVSTGVIALFKHGP